MMTRRQTVDRAFFRGTYLLRPVDTFMATVGCCCRSVALLVVLSHSMATYSQAVRFVCIRSVPSQYPCQPTLLSARASPTLPALLPVTHTCSTSHCCFLMGTSWSTRATFQTSVRLRR